MGPGRPIGTVKSRGTSSAFVRRRETFTKTLEEGTAKGDWITFTFQAGSNGHLFLQDIRITNLATMAISAGPGVVRSITPPGSVEYSFGLDVRSLNREPRLALLGIKLPTTSKLLKIRESLRAKVVAKLELLVDVDLDDEEFNMELNDLAITLVSTTQLNDEYESVSNRTRIVARATDAVVNQDPRDLTPTLIAECSFTSVRTLEYAFKEVLQMTPKQYIDFYRINLLRERLIAAPQIPILQLGDEVGLPHLGNLSRNYRNLYDETPSATKKRLASL
jgi:AraC family ethanolamine operon transcriptional activator